MHLVVPKRETVVKSDPESTPRLGAMHLIDLKSSSRLRAVHLMGPERETVVNSDLRIELSPRRRASRASRTRNCRQPRPLNRALA